MAKDRKSNDDSRITQSSVIPFRRVGQGIEVCLITTRRSRRWGFPKGTIPPSLSAEQAALAEAYEEAGLMGVVVGEPLGGYRYRKKGRRETVVVMLMEVNSFSDQWKEIDQRQRVWSDINTARQLLDRPNLQELLTRAVDRLAGFASNEPGSYLDEPDHFDGDPGDFEAIDPTQPPSTPSSF